jgi:small subunit ribosomal protein S4
MGHPRRHRKKYSTPPHPWQKDRILEEKELLREYGLKNKKEIWKTQAKLRKATKQVKKIIAAKNPKQAELEKQQLINKLLKYGLIKKDTKLEEILDLNIKDFLERRLQTIVFRKGLANSIKQARQFIVHGHIMIKDKKVTVPSYMVTLEEEHNVHVNPLSPLAKKEEVTEKPK